MLTLLTTYFRAQKHWRYGSIAAVLCLVIVGITAAPRGADAAIPLLIGLGAAAGGALAAFIARDQMLSGVAWIVSAIIDALQGLFINVVYLIVDVSRYTAFIDSVPVTRGWEIVRDVMNMFFVIVLLAIAVGTILQQEKYHYSKTLPKFIIAAILINFSKTIAGIFIDFANVVMLTFTGAIENTAGGNFLAMVGLVEFQQYVGAPGSSAVGVWETLLSLIVLLAFVVIALIVVVVMLIILIFRIVALWFLVVLSPAAFFLAALPDDKGYAKKWWDQFINYLIVGPIMLFFLWLSFTTLASSSQANNRPQIGSHISSVSATTTSPIPNKLGTAIGTPQTTLGFFLGIMMLLGSMAVAQQLGVEGGKMAGNVVQGAKDYVAGKKGPSPMRWARDRWSAYSKQREHDRQLRARMEVSAGMKLAGKAISIPGELAQQFIGTPIMTSKFGIGLRNWWKDVPIIGTNARDAAAQRRSEHMGNAQDLRNEAGEEKQTALNKNNRAMGLEGGDKDKLEEERNALQARIHELEADSKDPTKSIEERRKAEDEIESLTDRIATLNSDIAAFGGIASLQQQSDFLEARAKRLEDSTKEETAQEKSDREARSKPHEDQVKLLQSMIGLEKQDPDFGKDTPEGKRNAARIANLEEQLAAEQGKIEAAPEKLSEDKKNQKLREAEILREDKQRIDDAMLHERDGKGSAMGKLASDLRMEAIKAEAKAEKLEVKAKGEDWKATADLVRMEFPEFFMAAMKGGASVMLGGVFGPAMFAPFMADFLKASQNFGNRLTLEGQEVELEAIQSAAKKFGHLRDEVIKAIANGSAKGYSPLEQMAAKTEMMRRNLYDPSEVEGARRDFVKQGAGGAAVEAFDYDVYKQYPSQAFGMTPEKLVELVNKNRIDLSKLTKPESLNMALIKAINRLPTSISAQLMMRMKSSPIVENRAREIAEEELNRMEIQGTHKERKADGSIAPNRDYESFIKVLGMNRGFPDDHLGIGADGNFRKDISQEDKNFYQQVIVNATKDDDVAPYLLTGMHNKVFQNKDSDLMKILADQLRVDGPNGGMALHVMSAILRASKNGDRASANVAALSGALMHQIEARLGKDAAVLDEIYQIIKWKKTRVG